MPSEYFPVLSSSFRLTTVYSCRVLENRFTAPKALGAFPIHPFPFLLQASGKMDPFFTISVISPFLTQVFNLQKAFTFQLRTVSLPCCFPFVYATEPTKDFFFFSRVRFLPLKSYYEAAKVQNNNSQSKMQVFRDNPGPLTCSVTLSCFLFSEA